MRKRLFLLAVFATVTQAQATTPSGGKSGSPKRRAPAAGISDASENFGKIFLSFTTNVDSFIKLPCIKNSTKTGLQSFQKKSKNLGAEVSKNYSNYMANVTHSMNGSGKCAGGFEGVAKESGTRAQQSEDLKIQLQKHEKNFSQMAATEIIKTELTYNMNHGIDCAAKALSLLSYIEYGTTQVNSALKKMQGGLIFEEARFNSYKTQNQKLQSNCGQSQLAQGKIIKATKPSINTPPSQSPSHTSIKNPPQGPSSITGIQEDAEKQAREPASIGE